jgi:hypothetical protein
MAFATTQDVSARLRRELTEPEEDQAELLLEIATAVIAEAAGKSDEWAENLDPVPQLIWVVCVEVASRAMDNPSGYQSIQEQLGQYGRTVRYTDVAAGGGVFLSDREIMMVRRVVRGQLSGSVAVESILDQTGLCS